MGLFKSLRQGEWVDSATEAIENTESRYISLIESNAVRGLIAALALTSFGALLVVGASEISGPGDQAAFGEEVLPEDFPPTPHILTLREMAMGSISNPLLHSSKRSLYKVYAKPVLNNKAVVGGKKRRGRADRHRDRPTLPKAERDDSC